MHIITILSCDDKDVTKSLDRQDNGVVANTEQELYRRWSDVIVIMRRHFGGMLYVNKNRVKCGNLVILKPRHLQTLHFEKCSQQSASMRTFAMSLHYCNVVWELSVGWVDPRVGLVVGHKFLFSVGWVGSWVWNGGSAKNESRVCNIKCLFLHGLQSFRTTSMEL